MQLHYRVLLYAHISCYPTAAVRCISMPYTGSSARESAGRACCVCARVHDIYGSIRVEKFEKMRRKLPGKLRWLRLRVKNKVAGNLKMPWAGAATGKQSSQAVHDMRRPHAIIRYRPTAVGLLYDCTEHP